MSTVIHKYLARRLERMRWPQLLVLEGKHSTEHYLIADAAALWAAALEVLRSRVEVEEYIAEPTAPYGIEEGELTQAEMDKLPEPYRKQAVAVAQRNAKRREEHAAEVEEWREVQRALAERNGVEAFLILDRRSDGEYEGFKLVDLRVPQTGATR